VFDLADALVQAGARAVTVRRIDYAFTAENPLAERLLARL
ncbi:ATP phosphoribosyltransferase, partial [Methylobacterium trifolii]